MTVGDFSGFFACYASTQDRAGPRAGARSGFSFPYGSDPRTEMTQDFTKVGIQPKLPPGDHLTETIRHGLPPASGKAGLARAWGKLTGEIPPGADAPTKPLRKFIAGGWALLYVLRYAFGAVVALLVGLMFCYVSIADEFSAQRLAIGIGGLAASFLMGRSSWRAARELKSISKA